jgi:hypothetical protein
MSNFFTKLAKVKNRPNFFATVVISKNLAKI